MVSGWIGHAEEDDFVFVAFLVDGPIWIRRVHVG